MPDFDSRFVKERSLGQNINSKKHYQLLIIIVGTNIIIASITLPIRSSNNVFFQMSFDAIFNVVVSARSAKSSTTAELAHCRSADSVVSILCSRRFTEAKCHFLSKIQPQVIF